MRDKMHAGTKSIRPEPEQLDQIERWQYPDVEDEKLVERELKKTNVLGMRPGEWRRPEPEPEEEAPKPPTMEEIEAIRQAAYDDGFAEGKQAGHEEGHQQGHAQGTEQGHTEGLEQGRQEGLAQGQAIIDEKAQALDALIRQLHVPLANADQQVEQSLLKLTTHLAREVIRTELETNPNVILQVLHEAIGVLPLNTAAVSIDLHPEDLALVREQYDAEMLKERGWHLRAEPALSRGDVSITSERSYVDVSMQRRISDLMERFLHQSVPDVTPGVEPTPEHPPEAEPSPESHSATDLSPESGSSADETPDGEPDA